MRRPMPGRSYANPTRRESGRCAGECLTSHELLVQVNQISLVEPVTGVEPTTFSSPTIARCAQAPTTEGFRNFMRFLRILGRRRGGAPRVRGMRYRRLLFGGVSDGPEPVVGVQLRPPSSDLETSATTKASHHRAPRHQTRGDRRAPREPARRSRGARPLPRAGGTHHRQHPRRHLAAMARPRHPDTNTARRAAGNRTGGDWLNQIVDPSTIRE